MEIKMTHTDELLMERLKKEAREWINLELEARMAAVEDELAVQADVGSNLHCGGTIEKHVQDARAYARQEILRELEVQADEWVEEEYNKRMV
jgi:hypothetical protein